MNKKLKDILHLFGGGEQKFINDHFKNNMDLEVKSGHNFLKSNGNETLEFNISDKMDRVWNVGGTVPISGYQEIWFEEGCDDYGYGEIEYE